MTHDEVLVSFVWRLPLLLPCTHEPPARDDTWLDLRKMHLNHHTLLAGVAIPDLCDTVSRTSDFEENLLVNVLLCRCYHELGLFQVTGSSPCEVRLMLLPLRVREVRALVGVESKTETTFEGAKMVAEDVWVL